jgi:hypothetical protein
VLAFPKIFQLDSAQINCKTNPSAATSVYFKLKTATTERYLLIGETLQTKDITARIEAAAQKLPGKALRVPGS